MARSLRLGYITNGFRDHALEDVFAILAELGYDGVGITLDAGHLDPRRASRDDVLRVRDLLRRHGLEAVIETGGRFILDPRRKHHPTLIGATGRERRLELLLRAIEIAEALDSRAVSFWSGAQDPALDRDLSWRHLLDGLRVLEKKAASTAGGRIALAFEPEPGMLVASLADFRELRDRFRSPALRLTIDVGHLQCTEEPPHARWIRELAPIIANVHVDDIRGREHNHLPLGEGDIDFPPILEALVESGYAGLCLVELGRHSHAAPEMAEKSIGFLRRALRKLEPDPSF